MQIALIDPKILTFAGVEGSPYLWRPVATTLADAMSILRDAVAEMDARYQALARGGFMNLGERLHSTLLRNGSIALATGFFSSSIAQSLTSLTAPRPVRPTLSERGQNLRLL